MSPTSINEQQIVDALHRVPPKHWGEILAFIDRLQPVRGDEEPDMSSLAASIWTAAALHRLPRVQQDAVLREQAARLIEGHRVCPQPTTAWRWWTAREIRRLSRAHQDLILEASATIAAEEYATDPALTAFEAYGQDDLYVDSSNTETR